jgi:hypothetical protein
MKSILPTAESCRTRKFGFAAPTTGRYFHLKGRNHVFAKLVGAVTAVSVFLLYFWWRGTDPMLETALGFLLTAAAGLWAWWATERRQDRIERERSSGPPGGGRPGTP